MTLSRRLFASLLAVVAIAASATGATAQDLYDTTVLRTFNLSFHDANWLALLRQNYSSETPILADLEVDGVTYPNVGVRIRGNTSYTGLPSGSDKFSLKIYTDFVDPDQELMGYTNLNLNNGFRDPTFSREVVYNNYVAQFVPNPRANHVLVTLNGENWGVYINVMQPNKRMLRSYFDDVDGLRVQCANQSNGPGLAYNGSNPSGYTRYEIQDDGDLAAPWTTLIDVTYALSNEPLASWENIDHQFAIDPSIWSVVLENFLGDEDGYVSKGCDFMTYRNPVDGRMHLYQRDANETFRQSGWSVTQNFNVTSRPVLNRLMAVPELRQRYMAHYRTVKPDLSWAHFGPIFNAHRELIDAAVQADTKKLYSYTLFQNNFTSTVTMPYSGIAGGTITGLQQFVTQRAAALNGNAELNASGPDIESTQASNDMPDPSEPVWVTASVGPAGSAIQKVELFYRPTPQDVFQRVAMLDDGASGDGAADDGVFGALLPLAAGPGQRLAWYIAATSANADASLSFLPERSELDPRHIEYRIGSEPGIRITEWMYSGDSGEFVEFTNTSDTAIDMAGWSMDDDGATQGAFDLSAFGPVQPGESVIVTESLAEDFRTAWGLAAEVKIIGELGVASGSNFGRNDQIHLFNALGDPEDRLFYGDQTYPGSIRTQNASGQVPCSGVGQNDVLVWELSALGDEYGSFTASTGELGTPGSFVEVNCAVSDVIFADGFE